MMAPDRPGWYWRHPTGLREDAAHFYVVRVESAYGALRYCHVPWSSWLPVRDDGRWFGELVPPDPNLLR